MDSADIPSVPFFLFFFLSRRETVNVLTSPEGLGAGVAATVRVGGGRKAGAGGAAGGAGGGEGGAGAS